jgi:hypothetical protein
LLGILGERILRGFSGFRRQSHCWDGGDGEADRPAGPWRCGIPGMVADNGARAARVSDGPGAGGAGGICGTRAERERENDRGSEGDK